jgi:uncharacterized protein (TIGR02246 family)
MAACFTDDGEMIGFDGSEIRGRSQIADHLNAVFADHETAAFVANVKSVREVAPTAVLLRAAAGMVPPGGTDLNPAVNTHHTVLSEKRGDEWLIGLFQNTPAQFHGRPDETERWTEELRDVLRATNKRL